MLISRDWLTMILKKLYCNLLIYLFKACFTLHESISHGYKNRLMVLFTLRPFSPLCSLPSSLLLNAATWLRHLWPSLVQCHWRCLPLLYTCCLRKVQTVVTYTKNIEPSYFPVRWTREGWTQRTSGSSSLTKATFTAANESGMARDPAFLSNCGRQYETTQPR